MEAIRTRAAVAWCVAVAAVLLLALWPLVR